MAERLIQRDRSIIPAVDVRASKMDALIEQTHVVDGVEAYKVGLRIALELGLPNLVSRIREITPRHKIILDLQKAGNDIPLPTGPDFAEVCAESGIDSVILFPFTGPESQEAWTKAAQEMGLHVITGGHMTHGKFLRKDGGYIADEAPEEIYKKALDLGITDFVVPGNQPEYIEQYRRLFELYLGYGNFVLYSPGFFDQGGDLNESSKVAGDNWHPIVGGAIYRKRNMAAAAREMVQKLK